MSRRRLPFDPNLPHKAENQLSTLATLLTYLWPNGRLDLKVKVILAVTCLIGAKIFTTLAPFIWGLIVDRLSPTNSTIIVVPAALIIGYLIARLTTIIFNEFRDWIFVSVAQNAIREVALKTFKHLHKLSMRFHLDRQTGGLSRVIERGTRGIQFVLNFSIFNIFPTIIELTLVTVIFYFYFGIWYSVIALVSVFLYIFFTFGMTEWRLKFRREMNSADTESTTKSVDSLLNYETVKYFSNESYEAQRFNKSLLGYEKAAIKSQSTLSLLNIGQSLVVQSSLALILIISAFSVSQNTMTIGQFTMVNMYVMQLYIPLNFLGFVYREIKQSLVDMEVMFNLLDVESEIIDKPDAKILNISKGNIQFDTVNFSYNSNRKILKNISISVDHGRKIAIVGPSGSGKSTITRLLFRFYELDNGAIRIDGQNIKNFTQESLRENIGVVPQDTVLFNDTIGYNISYGKIGASQSEIESVAKMANIHNFVMSLPDQYMTRVGERGLKLSGGEKQRVAIARTMLKDPSILVFDEATSALDSHTEKEIQDSLNNVSMGKTTIIIAHRLSTIIDVDEIFVLVNGEIVESGDHHSLLSNGGKYASMWNKQQEEALREVKLDRTFGI